MRSYPGAFIGDSGVLRFKVLGLVKQPNKGTLMKRIIVMAVACALTVFAGTASAADGIGHRGNSATASSSSFRSAIAGKTGSAVETREGA